MVKLDNNDKKGNIVIRSKRPFQPRFPYLKPKKNLEKIIEKIYLNLD